MANLRRKSDRRISSGDGEKRFASDVGDKLIGQLVSSGYLAAVEKEDLKPLGDPLIWVLVNEERTVNDGKPRKVETEKLLAIEEALDHLVQSGAMTEQQAHETYKLRMGN